LLSSKHPPSNADFGIDISWIFLGCGVAEAQVTANPNCLVIGSLAWPVL
jgi:hypothetical protein